MTIRTLNEIKALFETGDTPTQQDFADLMDTLANLPLEVKASGAIIGPDLTGNTRGDYAIDFSTERILAGQVASGQRAIGIGTQMAASGREAIGIGYKANASARGAVSLGANSGVSQNRGLAFGDGASVDANYGIAFGMNAEVGLLSTDSIVIGRSSYAGFYGGVIILGYGVNNNYTYKSVIIGYQAKASGFGESGHVVIGDNAYSYGNHGVSIGAYSKAGAVAAVAAGFYTFATGAKSLALGVYSSASGTYSMAAGYAASASGYRSIAIGMSSTVAINATHGMAIGYNASAGLNHSYTVAIGPNVHSTKSNAVRIGPNDTKVIEIDNSTSSGQTNFYLFDHDNNNLERVTVGSADSGGSGYKVLRIPN